MSCDLLVASAGLTPVNGPLTLAGAKLAYDDRTGYFLPTQLPAKMFAAGRMTGREVWASVCLDPVRIVLLWDGPCIAAIPVEVSETGSDTGRDTGPGDDVTVSLANDSVTVRTPEYSRSYRCVDGQWVEAAD